MNEKVQNKLSKMDGVINKMRDLENSQQSLIGKIGQIEVDLFEIQSPDLDKELARVIDRASETLDIVKSAMNNFISKREALFKKNSPKKEF